MFHLIIFACWFGEKNNMPEFILLNLIKCKYTKHNSPISIFYYIAIFKDYLLYLDCLKCDNYNTIITTLTACKLKSFFNIGCQGICYSLL